MPNTISASQSEQLFLGATWALAHGDAGGFAQVVAELADRCSGTLREELIELSRQCHVDYEAACERWPGVCERAHAVLSRPPTKA